MPKKQKKFLSLLFLSGLLMLLVACGKTANSPIVAIANESEYEEVVAKDVTYLYFGFDDCPYCKEFRPILEKEFQRAIRHLFSRGFTGKKRFIINRVLESVFI